jgi:hypothetical protein
MKIRIKVTPVDKLKQMKVIIRKNMLESNKVKSTKVQTSKKTYSRKNFKKIKPNQNDL